LRIQLAAVTCPVAAASCCMGGVWKLIGEGWTLTGILPQMIGVWYNKPGNYRHRLFDDGGKKW